MQSSYGKHGASVVTYGSFGAASNGGFSVTDWPELVSLLRSMQDPYRKAEVLKARIASAKKARAPGFMIREMEAQLRAANRSIAQEKQGQAYTTEWRDLGQTSAVLGQVLLVGGIFVTIALTAKLLGSK